MKATNRNEMNSTMDDLGNEDHLITCRRVFVLESQLKSALEIIQLYAKDSWIDKAENYHFMHSDDVRLSRQFANDSWNAGMSDTEVNFGYPAIIEKHTDVVESEVSYWTE